MKMIDTKVVVSVLLALLIFELASAPLLARLPRAGA